MSSVEKQTIPFMERTEAFLRSRSLHPIFEMYTRSICSIFRLPDILNLDPSLIFTEPYNNTLNHQMLCTIHATSKQSRLMSNGSEVDAVSLKQLA